MLELQKIDYKLLLGYVHVLELEKGLEMSGLFR